MTNLSEELLDEMVNALTKLPYREVQHIFVKLAGEISQQDEDSPKIIQPQH